MAGTPDRAVDKVALEQNNVHLLSQSDPFPAQEVGQQTLLRNIRRQEKVQLLNRHGHQMTC